MDHFTKHTFDDQFDYNYSDGYINSTVKVEKLNSKDENENEKEKDQEGPKSLLIKKYGGNILECQVVKVNSPLVQSLIFYEQSKRGWGPKLYGLMDDGRIEEFVQCHTLKQEEAFTPEMMKDIAKAYARFHSLQLPVSQEAHNLMVKILLALDNLRTELSRALEGDCIADPDARSAFNKLLDFPFEKETKWINSVREKVQERIVFCSLDPNYLNRLVRDRPIDADGTRTIIIDFDFSNYSERGYDLGGHFVSRALNWAGKESKCSKLPYPNESERTAFLVSYLKECEKLFDDFDKTSLDSLENVTLEADLGALVFIAAILVFSLTLFTILPQQPKIFTLIDSLLNLFWKLKEDFRQKYPNLSAN